MNNTVCQRCALVIVPGVACQAPANTTNCAIQEERQRQQQMALRAQQAEDFATMCREYAGAESD